MAAIAIVAAPENWMNGTAAITATVTQVQTGVCRLGATFDSAPENGSWLSRAMPKQSLIVAARIDRQQTKIAADTTNRYSVANGVREVGLDDLSRTEAARDGALAGSGWPSACRAGTRRR